MGKRRMVSTIEGVTQTIDRRLTVYVAPSGRMAVIRDRDSGCCLEKFKALCAGLEKAGLGTVWDWPTVIEMQSQRIENGNSYFGVVMSPLKVWFEE